MNELQIFKNPEFGEVRTFTEQDGSVTFCGADSATALGYANTRDALIRHCKKDGVVNHDIIDSMGRKQQAKFISEGNLYRLITHSELPGAERFESWIFDEVLPSIRKTGSYSVKAPSTKKFSLASFNHLLEINIRQMKAAAEPAVHIAAWTNGMTRDVLAPFGINVPTLPDAVPPTYDATEIAKQLGIYSKAGKPHPQPITAIIKEVGLAPGETFTTATTAHGGRKDVPDVRYAESVLEKVHNWLNAAGWPNPIVLGKKFNVIYKYGVNPPESETASASAPRTCC